MYASTRLLRVFQPRFYFRYMLIGEALAIVCRLHNNRQSFRSFHRIDGRQNTAMIHGGYAMVHAHTGSALHDNRVGILVFVRLENTVLGRKEGRKEGKMW